MRRIDDPTDKSVVHAPDKSSVIESSAAGFISGSMRQAPQQCLIIAIRAKEKGCAEFLHSLFKTTEY